MPTVFWFKNCSGKYCLRDSGVGWRIISGYGLENECVDWIELRYVVDFCKCSNEIQDLQ